MKLKRELRKSHTHSSCGHKNIKLLHCFGSLYSFSVQLKATTERALIYGAFCDDISLQTASFYSSDAVWGEVMLLGTMHYSAKVILCGLQAQQGIKNTRYLSSFRKKLRFSSL